MKTGQSLTTLTLLGLLAVALAAEAPAACAQKASETVGMDTLLRQETDISRLPRLRDQTAHLQSSYDRSGGNADFGQYPEASGATATLADLTGPGAVVRIWSANPAEQIKIYIDDSPTAVVDAPFSKLFDGSLPPFVAPLAQPSSGGFYSYIPIPYAKHCRITVENVAKPDELKHLYYQVNYVTFPANTAVRSFALPLIPEDQSALYAAVSSWKAAQTPISRNAITKTYTVAIKARATSTIDAESGANVIRQLRVRIPDVDDIGLRQIVLRAYFDGHATPDIEAPVADFFGTPYGRKAFRSLLLGQTSDGFMEEQFPMPFGHSARFTLENGTSKSVTVTWNRTTMRERFDPKVDAYFHAQWWQERTRRDVPHIWAKVIGQRGHFVGIVQTMSGSRSLGYLEGDEQFRVDDQTWGASKVPATVIGPWNGTGTEDCFNSGWYYDKGINALPLNGLLVKEQKGGVSHIDTYRWFLNDAPVFQKSMDAQIEHGGHNDAPGVTYSSVAYWYADGPTVPWSATPAASAIKPLPPLPTNVSALVLKNAVEGESLVATATTTGGKAGGQDMWDYEGDWSGGRQLFWVANKVGDTMTLTLPNRPAGNYDLVGYFTKAVDYGQVSFTLNGKPVGGIFDGYNDGVVPSGPVALGPVTLTEGVNKLVVTVTGKNAASSNTLVGLDAFVLRPAAGK